ncbi:hypothetical protein [Pseudoalteromonas rubra]|uniref:hypothetical protein n=1 Tax=Pseudoalteromonas rubra TaxID=43658 RepID=UPI001029FC7A|nr:hypothetical protein [Pseudoalteromonas rubra]
MKLNLKKKSIKSLSSDSKKLPNAATPAVAGGTNSVACATELYCASNDCFTKEWIDNCNPHRYTYQGTGCCNTTLC